MKIATQAERVLQWSLIVFDDMIADMLSDKVLNSIAAELFFRGRKLNISLVFITHC